MNAVSYPLASARPFNAARLSTAAGASSRRAPAASTLDPIQLHADAHNALSMAVFYLRQPQANTAAARRKAIQALAALRSLSLAEEG